MNAGSSANSDNFYVFYTGDAVDRNSLKLQIEDKMKNVIVDSGASRNLMSEEVFDLVTGVVLSCWSATKEFLPMHL